MKLYEFEKHYIALAKYYFSLILYHSVRIGLKILKHETLSIAIGIVLLFIILLIAAAILDVFLRGIWVFLEKTLFRFSFL